MKNLLLAAIWLLVTAANYAHTETEITIVYFSSDEHALDEKAKESLSAFLQRINLTGDWEFQIQGHTDQEGDHNYNDALSERRAESVKNYLEGTGIDTQFLFTEAHGKTHLLFRDSDAQSKQKNRRVKVVFKRFYFETVDELMTELARSTKNNFQIDPSTVNNLQCEHGSTVFIPENAFVDQLGNLYLGSVNVMVTEALTYHDFFANGLQTLSDGKLLQTGGMMEIQAIAESGDTLYLNDSTSLSIALPIGRGSRLDGMSLFTSDNGANWVPTGIPSASSTTLQLPAKPTLGYSAMRLPRFVFDENTRPKYPSEPMYPIAPRQPRQESYNRKSQWYEVFSKRKIAIENQMRFERALVNYDAKVNKYLEAIEKYHRDIQNHPRWVAEYKIKLAAWEEGRLLSEKDFNEKDWKEASEKITEINAEERAKYNRAFAVWDSIYSIRMVEYNKMLVRLGFPSGADPNSYLFEVSNLGWINCDKFYNVPDEKKFQMVARLPESDVSPNVLIVLPNLKSVVSCGQESAKYFRSPSIPQDEEVIVIAYAIEEGGIRVAHSRTKGKIAVSLEYRPIGLSAFRKFLNDLVI